MVFQIGLSVVHVFSDQLKKTKVVWKRSLPMTLKINVMRSGKSCLLLKSWVSGVIHSFMIRSDPEPGP